MISAARLGTPCALCRSLVPSTGRPSASENEHPMVVVGVIARVDPSARSAVKAALGREPGVSPFELPVQEDGRIGFVLEAATIEAAHALLTKRIDAMDGVLGTWPVHVDFDTPDGADAGSGREP